MNIIEYTELCALRGALFQLGYLITVDKNGVPRLRSLDGKFACVKL